MIRSISLLSKKITQSVTRASWMLLLPYQQNSFKTKSHSSIRNLATTGRNDCIALDKTLPDSIESVEKPEEKATISYPRDIVTYLDQFVIGQDLAKRNLAVGVYQHYKRVEYNRQIKERAFIREAMLVANEELAIDRSKIKCKHKKSFHKKIMALLDDIKNSKYHVVGIEAEHLFIRAAALALDPPKKQEQEKIKSPDSGLNFNSNLNEDDMALDKSNILLLGPSGSGKTYLTQKLAEALDVPIAMCDCTTLTEAGYVGDNVETVIEKLLQAADGDQEKAQRGIVFLDEFDKLYSSDCQHRGTRDVGGRGVQQALLKLIEGCRLSVTNSSNRYNSVEIDTSNILFIASGAFSGVERVVAKRIDNRSVGFSSASIRLSEDLDATDDKLAMESKIQLLSETDHGDLISFGMVPELVGRFPVLVPFLPLSEEMLRQVMTKPKNNIISQSKKLFKMDNIELEFTDCAISEIAKLAVKRKTGARAIRSIMEKVLLNAKFECPGKVEGRILINGEVVRGENKFGKQKATNTAKK